MSTIAVLTQTSSTARFASILLPSVAMTAYRPPATRVIDGSLPGGRYLAYPLMVLIEYDDGEVVVHEPQFHMHASAPTEAEAIAAFRRIFSGYLDVLGAEEATLSEYLHDQLEYLRSAIRSV